MMSSWMSRRSIKNAYAQTVDVSDCAEIQLRHEQLDASKSTHTIASPANEIHRVSRNLRRAALVVGLLWVLSVTCEVGFTADIMPISVALDDGYPYAWLINHMDGLLTIALALLVVSILVKEGYSRNDSDSSNMSNKDSNDSYSTAQQKYKTLAHPLPWVVTALILILGIMIISRISVNSFRTQLLAGAARIQLTGSTQAAIDSVQSILDSKYSSADNAAYFYASGWEQDLGHTQQAISLDINLIKSSTQNGSIYNLAVGLTQDYSLTKKPISKRLSSWVRSAIKGHPWESADLAMLQWNRSQDTHILSKSLLSDEIAGDNLLDNNIQQTVLWLKNRNLR